jgi:SNF2 family DNA or RNA helicase
MNTYAYAEVMDNGKRIMVTWHGVSTEIFQANVKAIKQIPGRTFVGRDKAPGGKPFWHVPLDMETCRYLRSAFGPLNHQAQRGLAIGPVLRRWATEEVGAERNLSRLAAADTAALERLPSVLPELAQAIHIGPRGIGMTPEQRAQALQEPACYQAADVAFLANAKGPLNACHMGLGKTIELIASIFEAGMDDGPQLIIAPIVALSTVWKRELERWQPHPVLVAAGTRREREAVLEQARLKASRKEPFFLVVNPAMITLAKDPAFRENVYVRKATPADMRKNTPCDCSRLADPHWHYGWRYDAFRDIHFRTVVLDEADRAAIGNTKAITNVALRKLQSDKRICMTGTPMGGKPIRLFGILQWLNPSTFTSKWNWAERWLEIHDNGYGKTIGKLIPERREDFYKSLAPYVLRRTKAEVAKWLPPKQYVNVWVEMEGPQKKQYEKWDADLEMEIEENRLIGRSVLDVYTRLRQFAIAEQIVEDYNDETGHVSLYPTTNSCKLPALLQILDELGLTSDEAAEGEAEQVVIFSQYTRVVEMVSDWLEDQGILNATITGKVDGAERDRLQRQFQNGDLKVLVMNVKAGGVAITLDRANTAVFLDETWNPDDQEQAEDRIHRVSRIHQVTIYYIRTKDTIEERVFDEVTGKQMSNTDILDTRRNQ